LFTLEKNPRFTAFLDSNLHTRLAIVTENELGLVFPPKNLPKKFRPDPSTFYLVIVVTNRQTDRQTDRQTNAGKNIIPRFRGDNDASPLQHARPHVVRKMQMASSGSCVATLSPCQRVGEIKAAVAGCGLPAGVRTFLLPGHVSPGHGFREIVHDSDTSGQGVSRLYCYRTQK